MLKAACGKADNTPLAVVIGFTRDELARCRTKVMIIDTRELRMPLPFDYIAVGKAPPSGRCTPELLGMSPQDARRTLVALLASDDTFDAFLADIDNAHFHIEAGGIRITFVFAENDKDLEDRFDASIKGTTAMVHRLHGGPTDILPSIN